MTEQTLANISLFADLSDAERAALSKRCRWRRYTADQQILAHHDATSDIFFVVEGSARATFFTKSGKQVTFRDIPVGGYFGELAAVDKDPRAASIVALSESLIASMPSDGFHQVMEQHPTVARFLLRHFARQVRFLTERVIEYSALDVNGRVDAEVLRLARAVANGANSAEIKPAPMHAEIASRVATHREAVTRELNHLDRLGILERHPGRWIVKDIGKLAGMVEKILGD